MSDDRHFSHWSSLRVARIMPKISLIGYGIAAALNFWLRPSGRGYFSMKNNIFVAASFQADDVAAWWWDQFPCCRYRCWEAVFDVEVIVENDIRPSVAAAWLVGLTGVRYHDWLFFLTISPVFLSFLASKPMSVGFPVISCGGNSCFCYFIFLCGCVVDDLALVGRNCRF